MPFKEVLLMKEIYRKIKSSAGYLFFTVALLALLFFIPLAVHAQNTDELKNFTITVDVNEDASLKMAYHIDWKVLDDSIGKLEWIDLGVPNRYHEDITPLSDTIDHIKDNGSTLAIYLDRSYGEGETVSIDFSMTQDHMYQIDKWTEGETVYTFTPAWFDSMDVDQITIRWNGEKAGAWQPDCMQEDGYLTFTSSLSAGQKYTISVTYPNDAFAFDVSRQENSSEGGTSDTEEEFGIWGLVGELIGVAFCIALIASPFIFIYKLFTWILGGIGFGSEEKTQKKITRTKIEYYESCPSCGAAREEGKDSCPYCGRSMIKSKEIVEEKELENPENYTRKGTYRYGDSANTYIRVNVINVPVSRPRSSGSHKGGGRSSHHSSCACASSCASCACASSCACACACASSGRAGCSVKDFYKESIHRKRIFVDSKVSEWVKQ